LQEKIETFVNIWDSVIIWDYPVNVSTKKNPDQAENKRPALYEYTHHSKMRALPPGRAAGPVRSVRAL
jgi:hypothetical protein